MLAILQSPSGRAGEFVGSTTVALTFKQLKELLLLQMEMDKLGIRKELLRQSLEKEKLELQQYQLDLIEASKLSGNAGARCSEHLSYLIHKVGKCLTW